MLKRVVIEMTKRLFKSGHIVYTDNFFTSPTLAHYLSTKGTYLCGTVRSGRKGYPQQLVKTGVEARHLPRGHSEWMQSGNITAQCWKDNKMVYYLSSCHLPTSDKTVTRRKKDGSLENIPCSAIVCDYQKYMGSVDTMDQMTRQNRSKKTMKWYRRVERKLMECAIHNAYVIEGHTINHHPPGKEERGMLHFKLELAHQLVGTFRRPRRAAGRSRSNENRSRLRLNESLHLPVPGEGKDHTCTVCATRHNNYKRAHPDVSYSDNPHKLRKTTMKCEKCNIYLCCNNKTLCFKEWHTLVRI